MASRFILPLSDVGKGISPSDGAKLNFFATGTSTLKATFSDEAATTKNPNPVIANQDGLFPEIWITGEYKVTLKDKNNVPQWEEDPVIEGSSATTTSKAFDTIADVVADTSLFIGQSISVCDYATGNSSGVLFFKVVGENTGTADGGSFIDLPNTTPALQLQQNFPGTLFAAAFGAVFDGSTLNTTFIQNALEYGAVIGRLVHLPGGEGISGPLFVKGVGGLVGQGWRTGTIVNSTELTLAAGSDDSLINFLDPPSRYGQVRNMALSGNSGSQSGTSHGINLVRTDEGITSGSSFLFEDVFVKDFLNDGIAMGGRCNGTTLRRVYSNFNLGNGISNFAGDQHYLGCESFSNTEAGFVDSGFGGMYSNCKAWFNGENDGVEADGDFGGIGISDGAVSTTVMTDSTQSLLVDMYAGKTIFNNADGSSAVVSSNTATTITSAALSGGSSNDWAVGDDWSITETVARQPGFNISSGPRGIIMASCYAQENYGPGIRANGGSNINGQLAVDGNSITYQEGDVRGSTSRIHPGAELINVDNCNLMLTGDRFQTGIDPTFQSQSYAVRMDTSCTNNIITLAAVRHTETAVSGVISYAAVTGDGSQNYVVVNGKALTSPVQVETVANQSTSNANNYGLTLLDASTGFTQVTLPGGTVPAAGVQKSFRTIDASNAIQVIINDHESGTLTQTMNTVGDTLVLESNGSKWMTIHSSGTANVNNGTTTDFTGIARNINTGGKFEGKAGFNTTTNRPVWAVGSAAGDLWLFADGTTAHTPV